MTYPPSYPPGGAPPPWPQPPVPGWPGPYWGPPPPPPRRRWTRRTVALVAGGAVLGAAVLVLVVVAGLNIGRSQGASSLAAVAPSTAPPSDPAGLGDDAGLDLYAQQCHDGALPACDNLLGLSPSGSTYEQYGLTCGGRVKPYDVSACTDLGGPEPTSPPSAAPVGADPGLDGYAQRCHDGLLSACDDLYSLSPPMSEYERYAMSCGGRVPAMDVTTCAELGGD